MLATLKRVLGGPNLVRLGELVVDGEQWAFTMELLDGVAFVEHVRGRLDTTADTPPCAGRVRRCPAARVQEPRPGTWELGERDRG